MFRLMNEPLTMTDDLHVSPEKSDRNAPADDPASESAGRKWYVLKVQSNRERSIRDSLLKRIKREGLEEYFGAIVIPTEKVVETKGGKKKVREQKLFPGYMMIEMELNDATWYLVRDTSGVGDFTGAAGKPIAMQPHEISRMLGEPEEGQEAKPTQPVVKFSVEVGDVVKVKEGPFESFEGTVDSLDETSGKVKVMIEIFGRSTEVELEHWQVEKV
jgi:transcriptional antiterminator NusG